MRRSFINPVHRVAAIMFVLSLTFSGIAGADDVIKRTLEPGPMAPDASGRFVVLDNHSGPDMFRLIARNLDPDTRYTVFLTQSSTDGALPHMFLGEFTTNGTGTGRMRLIVEIINGYDGANQSLEDGMGIADIAGAGKLTSGANTIALNFIRLYVAEGGFNVFGPSESEFGGPLVLFSTDPLP